MKDTNGGGRVSNSAVAVARHRALHVRLDSPVVLDDWVSERLLPADEPSLSEQLEGSSRSSRRRARQLRSPATRKVRAFLAARAALAEQLCPVGYQRVVLAAGLDSWGLREPGEVTFEVDLADTQLWKRERVREAGLEDSQVRYVSGDVRDMEAVFASLRTAGWREEEGTYFTLLGLVAYLPPAEVSRLVRALGAVRGPSALVLDYGLPETTLSPEALFWYRRRADRSAQHGEPWLSTWDPVALSALLSAAGLPSQRHWSSVQLGAVFDIAPEWCVPDGSHSCRLVYASSEPE